MARAPNADRRGGVFLSYRRDDTRHVAGRLYDRLAARFGNTMIFMDVDSIEPGLDFALAIDNAVASCDVLLVLIGPNWLNAADGHGRRRLDDPNDFVVLEISSALRRGMRVIPVLVDGAAPPRATDLPMSLAYLARRNAFRLDHESFGSDTDALLAVVARAVPRHDAVPPARPPTPNRPVPAAAAVRSPAGPGPDRGAPPRGQPRISGRLLVGIAGAAAVVTTATVLVYVGLPDGGDPARPPSSTSVAPPSETPTGTATPTSTVPSSPAVSPTAVGDSLDPVAFVQSYYALLPAETEAAWGLLGEQAQAKSGGRAGFDAFYAGLRSVSVQNLRQTGERTAECVVVLVRKSGSTSSEPYRFELVTTQDGRTVIEDFSRP